MTRRVWPPIAAAAAAVLVILGTQDTTAFLDPYTRALLCAWALFGVPGWLACRCLGIGPGREAAERPALAFVASLAVLLPALAWPFLVAGPLRTFVPVYIATVVLLAAVSVAIVPPTPEPTPARNTTAGPLIITLSILLAVLLTAAAWHLTRTGSIDRWWYLAYVRGYLESHALGFGEPFFDGATVVDRFRFNGWLVALAAWARCARVDPVWLYERVCPLLLVPLSFSAALVFANSLFGRGRTAWLVVLASGLLWAGGSLFPVSTRIPEDKLMALLTVAPVTVGVFLTRANGDGKRWLGLLVACAAVQATIHALVYGIVLLTVVPVALWWAWRMPAERARFVVMIAVLAAGALYPLWTGLGSRQALIADGSTLAHLDHPVVRVHHSRGRLIELDDGSYLVRPQLLRHPLTLLAVVALPLVWLRRPRARDFLLASSVIPAAVAFVPPLAGLAGRLILPWMVYRLLWAVPYTCLIAVAVDATSRLSGRYRWLPVLALVSLSMPWTVGVLGGRPDAQRSELAVPDDGAFREAMVRVAALPRDAVVAAAPEISERIPGLTGRRVLAVSDRGSVVFAGSRSAGERRLRARAAIMAGLWRPEPGVPTPTHVLFETGTAASVYCGAQLFRLASFELCTFHAAAPSPGVRLPEASEESDGAVRVGLWSMLFDGSAPYRATCTPALDEQANFLHWPRPGPWSPRYPHAFCTIQRRGGNGARFQPRTLVLEPFLGNAVEELLVNVAGQRDGRVRWRMRTRRRLRSHETVRFEFPNGTVDGVRISITPAFLPFLKLARLDVTFDAHDRPVGQP